MDPAEMSSDDIRRELSSIAIQLTELPEDDFATRLDLRERQTALRDAVASRPVGPADVASMKRELAGLQRRLLEIMDERPNIAAMNDGGQGQAGMAETQQWAWDYDEGTGRNEIRDRIVYLERRISEAEV